MYSLVPLPRIAHGAISNVIVAGAVHALVLHDGGVIRGHEDGARPNGEVDERTAVGAVARKAAIRAKVPFAGIDDVDLKRGPVRRGRDVGVNRGSSRGASGAQKQDEKITHRTSLCWRYTA